MRITVTCEACGYGHPLEREFSRPAEIWVVCHGCELPLRAALEPVAAPVGAAALRTPFAEVWERTIDLGLGTV